MRKHLRKKKHIGEFVEWSLPMAVRRRHLDDFDDFLDACIAQAIAAHGLAFGGGGHDDRVTGVIEVGSMTDPIKARQQLIRRWLDACEDSEHALVGTQADLGHRPFDALDAIAERLPERSTSLRLLTQ